MTRDSKFFSVKLIIIRVWTKKRRNCLWKYFGGLGFSDPFGLDLNWPNVAETQTEVVQSEGW